MKTKHWFQVFFPFPDFNVIDKKKKKKMDYWYNIDCTVSTVNEV